MSNNTQEFRVTRPGLYTATGCPGYTDVGSRQGYYIRVSDGGTEKLIQMLATEPLCGDKPEPVIDVQRWNSDESPRVVRRYYWDESARRYRFLREWESAPYRP